MMGRAVFGAEKGGRWDGIQRGLGGEAKGKTERKEREGGATQGTGSVLLVERQLAG